MGTADALTDLVTDIQLSISRKLHLGAVNINSLQTKIIKIGLPEQIAFTICNLYKNRTVLLRTPTNKFLGPRMFDEGLLQGSILSLLLFNLR